MARANAARFPAFELPIPLAALSDMSAPELLPAFSDDLTALILKAR